MAIYPESSEVQCNVQCNAMHGSQGRDPLLRAIVHAMRFGPSSLHWALAKPLPTSQPPTGRPACCPAIAASA